MNNPIKEVVKNWLQYAGEDLELAKRELNYIDEEVLIRTVCFHCQQAVEKYLKAFLVFNEKNFRKTHDLDEIKELCLEVDSEFEKFEVGVLTLYAVESRYPNHFVVPTLAEAKEAYRLACQVKEFILAKLKEVNE